MSEEKEKKVQKKAVKKTAKKVEKETPETEKPEKEIHAHTKEELSKEATLVVKEKKKVKTYKPNGAVYYGTGKRKDAIARVYLKPGEGKYTINKKDVSEYFLNRAVLIQKIRKPLSVVDMQDKYDVTATTYSGGRSGQAGAVAHGIAKAIVQINPDLKKMLKIEGLITRDSRVKESKKYGRKGARKGKTYRKR